MKIIHQEHRAPGGITTQSQPITVGILRSMQQGQAVRKNKGNRNAEVA